MAVRYWVGGTGSQSFQSTGNWSATRNGASGASYPTGTDTAYILDGTSNIDSGLSNAAFTGALTISFGGNIGTAGGTPLATECQGIFYSGTGAYAFLSGTVTQLSLWSSNGMVTWNAGTLSTAYIGPNALLTVSGTGTLTTGYNAGGIVSLNGGNCTLFENYDGTVQSTVDVATLNIYAGQANNQNAATNSTKVTIFSGATLQHSSTGTLTFVYAYPNSYVIDAGAPGPFTVTAAELWPNASLFQNPSVSITYTNPTGHRAMP